MKCGVRRLPIAIQNCLLSADSTFNNAMIPLAQCQDGHLYIIAARNAYLGIFRAEFQGFVISRAKLGSSTLSIEDHVETGPPHGTATPLEDLGPVDTDGARKSATLDFLNTHPQLKRAQLMATKSRFIAAGIAEADIPQRFL